jgi:hypothetical protein
VNLTYAHALVVIVVLLSVTVLGVEHVIRGESITNVYIACLGSLSGHAVGYAAGKESERDGK